MRVSAFNVIKRTRPGIRDFNQGKIEARADGWYYVRGRESELVAEVPHLLKILVAANIATCGTVALDDSKPMIDLVQFDPNSEDPDVPESSKELQETPTGESDDQSSHGNEEEEDAGTEEDGSDESESFVVTDDDDTQVDADATGGGDDVIFESDELSGPTIVTEDDNVPANEPVVELSLTDIRCRRAITSDDFKSIETSVLKQLCEDMKLATTGTKKVLAGRINKARGIVE